MTDAAQKGLMRRLVVAVRASVDSFRKSAPLREPPCKSQTDYPKNAQNRKLVDAIMSGDYAKAREAIDCGANVNKRDIDFTSDEACRPSDPSNNVIFLPEITPLALARKLNRPDFEELLKRHGAKE